MMFGRPTHSRATELMEGSASSALKIHVCLFFEIEDIINANLVHKLRYVTH